MNACKAKNIKLTHLDELKNKICMNNYSSNFFDFERGVPKL